MNRKQICLLSNNRENPNKNICVLRVAEFLGADKATRYLHHLDDLLRAVRKSQWSARSRKSQLRKKNTSFLKTECPCISKKDKELILFFIVVVPGHVFLVNRSGQTVVDTAPFSSRNREILHFYAVW